MQSRGCLPFVLDAHSERSLEALGSRSDRVGVLSPDDPLLGGVSHLKMAGSDLCPVNRSTPTPATPRKSRALSRRADPFETDGMFRPHASVAGCE